MTGRQQTSVRISVRGIETLLAIARSRGVSRDEAVRQVLEEHLLAQSAAPEEQRLTHISTVLRFPPPPLGRGGTDGRVRLAVRLDDGVAQRAGSLSLRLPGQAASRGFRDYGARPLTDALVTAIARVEPFVDDGLTGLPALLTHRQALGLWRLAVAATLTRAEQRVLYGRDRDDGVSVVLREEDVAWHHPWRFEVALHLARRLLVGGGADAGLAMLTAQTVKYGVDLSDLELTDDLDHRLLHGLGEPLHDRQGLQGRGGTAVWRARRSIAMTDLARWVTNPSRSSTHPVEPPGWKLTMPPGWRGYSFGHGVALPPTRQADLDAGRVLRIDAGANSVLWPYGLAGVPVPGFESVIGGAGNLAPAELVELVLLGREDQMVYPHVPAGKAHELGFISKAERDVLTADADDRTRRSIRAALKRAARLGEAEQQELRDAMDDPRLFARLAARSHIRCSIALPWWRWEVGSVAEALAGGVTPARLEWLAGAARRIRQHLLEVDMQRAWRDAFWLGRPYPDEPLV